MNRAPGSLGMPAGAREALELATQATARTYDGFQPFPILSGLPALVYPFPYPKGSR